VHSKKQVFPPILCAAPQFHEIEFLVRNRFFVSYQTVRTNGMKYNWDMIVRVRNDQGG
jgi:hypothetical protein